MLDSVKGIYQKGIIKPLNKLDIEENQEVIITFMCSEKDEYLNREISSLAESGGAFDFLKAAEEDIYTDKDLKLTYHD